MTTTLTHSTPVKLTEPRNAAWTDHAPSFPPIKTRGMPIALLGVPFDNVTTAETVALVERMVASGRAHYLVTANVDFLVQALHDVELRRILFEAHLVLCDGTPLLWASRWLGNGLSERVAGSDLVPLLIRIAAQRGYRIFFLGGSPEATIQAVAKLQIQYPDLIIAGHYSPPFRDLLRMDHQEIKRRIQCARPDLLFVSFGCPKQEKWLAMHYRSLNVPVSIGVGGTIDFLAGRVVRAPQWMQRTGIEWIFRLAQEPRRLFKRYARDCWYFGGRLLAQWCRMQLGSSRRPPARSPAGVAHVGTCQEVCCPEWLDAEAVARDSVVWERALAENAHLLLDLEKVRFIDSTGVGLLIRLRKRANAQGRHLILVAPSAAVRRTLESMRLWPFFVSAPDRAEAMLALERLAGSIPAVVKPALAAAAPTLAWQGEITAANADVAGQATAAYIDAQAAAHPKLIVDLSDVTFIDSTGLGLMVRAKREAANAGAALTFVGLQENVRNVVELSKLEAYLLRE